ncbi:addiction module protein [Turneriella parva]|nr:addiction module protein [Turneriella parva]
MPTKSSHTVPVGVQEALIAINSLSKDQQLELVGKVWENLAPESPSPDWHRALIEQRLADAENSASHADTWENVEKRIRARL